MLVKARKRKVVSVVEDVRCNKCGESCRDQELADDGHPDVFNSTRLDVRPGGYGSRFEDIWSDDPVDPIHLCDDCCVALLLSMKLPPTFNVPGLSRTATPQEIWG